MKIGPLYKVDEFRMETAWGDIWKVIILGDRASKGKIYAEAHIKKVEKC